MSLIEIKKSHAPTDSAKGFRSHTQIGGNVVLRDVLQPMRFVNHKLLIEHIRRFGDTVVLKLLFVFEDFLESKIDKGFAAFVLLKQLSEGCFVDRKYLYVG